MVILLKIQNIKMNYFELFGLPIEFQVDTSKLRVSFMQMQLESHPDKFAQSTVDDQEIALERSALANQGYTLLNNKEKLIPYVLELKGYIVADEKFALSPDFLMEMMDLNESWMDAATPEQKQIILDKVKSIQNELYEPIKQFLEGTPIDSLSQEDMLQIKEYYYKKKYLDRILADFRY